jgi:hypothetical protein
MESPIRRIYYILVFLAVACVSFHTSPSNAQVIETTARITVIVIPPAGIHFVSGNTDGNSLQLQPSTDHGMMFQTSSNVAVVLDSLGGRITLNDKNIGQGTTKIFTSRNLSGVSKVEAIFLGN